MMLVRNILNTALIMPNIIRESMNGLRNTDYVREHIVRAGVRGLILADADMWVTRVRIVHEP